MRTVCFIEARMRSTRLPGKVLRPILGRPMLGLMIERLQRARTLDGIVVATSDAPADEPIAELARQLEVGCFRGSEDDVLGRVLGAAHAHDAEVIVETTGDCPLHDPAIVDFVVAAHRMGGSRFTTNIMPYSTPRGTDVRVFSTRDLDEVNRISSDPADHEHVSLYFIERPEEFGLRNVSIELGSDAPNYRLTVDTSEDFELVRLVYEELYPANPHFTVCDVLDLLRRRPDLSSINSGIEQKAAR